MTPDGASVDEPGAADWEVLTTLILRAFVLARASGKEDWHRMYAGVLKNRLLLITDSRFDQARWGATLFTALLERLPDLVRVDRSVTPPMVELVDRDRLQTLEASLDRPPAELVVEHPTSEHPTSDTRRWRIRRDLWDAVLGVRDADAFIWEHGDVIRLPQDEAAGHEGARLPTLTGPELDSWQGDFASEQPPDAGYATVLDGWARGDHSTAELPRHLRHLWYARLKRLVRDRLEDWFEQQGIAVPADMIELPSTGRIRRSESGSDLRKLVVACVRVMTDDELRELRLPPEAVLRMRN